MSGIKWLTLDNKRPGHQVYLVHICTFFFAMLNFYAVKHKVLNHVPQKTNLPEEQGKILTQSVLASGNQFLEQHHGSSWNKDPGRMKNELNEELKIWNKPWTSTNSSVFLTKLLRDGLLKILIRISISIVKDTISSILESTKTCRMLLLKLVASRYMIISSYASK